MDLGFTKNDILGDVAEGLRDEQGDRLQQTLLYEIEDKAGHPVTTSIRWYKAANLLGAYEWLTLVKAYGPAFANRSLARLGFKLVPIGGGEIDEAEFLEAEAEKLEAQARQMRQRAGAAGVKLRAV